MAVLCTLVNPITYSINVMGVQYTQPMKINMYINNYIENPDELINYIIMVSGKGYQLLNVPYIYITTIIIARKYVNFLNYKKMPIKI